MRWRTGGGRAALVAVLGLLLAAPAASVVADDVNGNGKYWPFHKTPVTVTFGDNVSNKWARYVKRAAKQWNRSKVVRPKIARGRSSPSQCNKRDDTVQVCNSGSGTREGWLGLTTLYFNGDKIYAATIKINDDFFNQGSYNSAAPKRHTMCHEMGHEFGLDHANSRSCMNDSASAVFNNTKPIKQDFKDLKQIYNKKNRKTSTVATAGEPSGVLEIPQSAPHEVTRTFWLPDGTKQVTHLTWGETEVGESGSRQVGK
jgi:hypothetical protein